MTKPIRKLRIQLMAAVAAVLAIIWVAVAHQLGRERADAVEIASQHGQNLGSVVAGHFAAYVETVDLLLRRFRVQWIKDPRGLAETMALEKELRGDAFPVRVSVIDAHGHLAYASPDRERAFLGDAEYFIAHRSKPADELRISNPTGDGASGTALIHFTRPILDARGRFSGVLVLSVSLESLTQVYEGLQLGPKSLVGIRRLDNTLLVRWPDSRSPGGRLPEIPQSAAVAGSEIRRGALDGVERIFNFQRVAGLPFYAVIGLGLDAVLADYRSERRFYLAAGAFLSLVVAWFALALLSKLRREEDVEIALSRSEERFRSLTQLASDMYWEQDREYRFVSVTGKGPPWVARGRGEVVGKRRWDFQYLNMTQADWAAHIAMLDARKPFQDLEVCRLDEGGRKVWVSISGEPVFDASGFTGYRGIGKDITARKRDESLLRLEHSVARHLADAVSAAEGLKAVMRAICETEDWDCARYFRWDEAAGALRFHESWSVPGAQIDSFIEKSRALVYATGTGLIGRTFQSERPQWSLDTDTDPRVARRGVGAEAGMHGAFFFPVASREKVLGVVAFNSREVREPDTRLLDAVGVIGNMLGQFLRRQAAEEELSRFRLAMDNSADMIVLIDRSSMRFVDVNETACRQLGYSREELLKLGPADVLPPTREELERDYDALIARPAGEMEQVTSGMKSEYTCKDGSKLPFESTRHVLRSGDTYIIAAISRDIRARLEIEERVAYLAQFDALTGLPNRNLFQDRLAQGMALASRNDQTMAVLFIDLDRFKLVNDTLGHGAGDKLLKESADRLRSCVRRSDTVGRLGGDEFAAILAELGQPADAARVAQKIVEAFRRPFDIEGKETYVSASIGITLYPTDSDDAEALVTNADAAMYRAKEQGRNNYQFFTRGMNERALQRGYLEVALRKALVREEFRLFYQPKVHLATGRICGFEALLRWQHPEKGTVSPGEFIPVLEETGLIVPVGEWLLRTACSQIKAWQQSGLKVPPISVNLSARQFGQKNLTDAVHEVLSETGVDPSLIEFEITESLLMHDPEGATRTLHSLKDSGVKLSLDDFGTGYSSLGYLKRFPIDTLKIDRTFVRDITTDADDATLTRAIIHLAQNLRLKVVAEGVETEAQLNFLRANGCDEIQGYLFARPTDAEECGRMLREGRRLAIPRNGRKSGAQIRRA